MHGNFFEFTFGPMMRIFMTLTCNKMELEETGPCFLGHSAAFSLDVQAKNEKNPWKIWHFLDKT